MAAWLCLALFQGAFAAAAFSAEEAGGDSDLPLSLLQTRTYQTCTYTGAAEEVAPLQRLQTIPETIPEIARPSRLAVFVQAANASLFADARRCVEQVAAAQVVLAGTTNVFVAALNHADAARFSKEMEYLPAQVTVEVFQNRGADVGLFLQQLQGRPLNYDFILKIHTKSSNVLREHALSQLCGDTDVVKQVLAHFHAEPRLQMVGPQGLVLENASDFSTIERLWDDRNVKFALWPWEERAAEAGTRLWRSRHRRVSGEGLAFAQRKALPAQEQLDHHGNQLLLDEIHEPGLLWQVAARDPRIGCHHAVWLRDR
ncbi:unnamed protein product [Effrenium voratum]|nr:unnamed protein product [Effrenium voratum]